MLDGDENLAQALRLAPNAVVGVGLAVLAAQGLVGAVALDGIAGAAGVQLLHQTHSVEETLLLTVVWKRKTRGEKALIEDLWPAYSCSARMHLYSFYFLLSSSGLSFNLSPICIDTDKAF